MKSTVPTVFQITTRGWGAVPMIGIRIGPRTRLVATPDFEQAQGEQGKHVPAWFEDTDCEAPEEFYAALDKARKELA